MNIADVLKENKRRNELLHASSDPLTGFGSPIARFMIKVVGSFFLWLPESMKQLDIIQELLKYASISDYVGIIYGEDHISTKVSRFQIETILTEINKIKINLSVKHRLFYRFQK